MAGGWLVLFSLWFLLGATMPAGAADKSTEQWVPPEPANPKVQRITFDSHLANQPVGFHIYLPESYRTNQEQRFPVIYWLHGKGGNANGANVLIRRLDKAIADQAFPPIIVVGLNSPTRETKWTDSKDGKVLIESVIIQEIIPYVDQHYRTVAKRESRAIEGFSMGGYGAAYLGFKYPDVFGVVSILGGAVHRPEFFRDNRPSAFAATFGNDLPYATKNSPWTLVRKNADAIRGRTVIRQFVGSEDQLRFENTELHQLIESLGIKHEWGIVPNVRHSATQMYETLESPLDFFRVLVIPARSGTPDGKASNG